MDYIFEDWQYANEKILNNLYDILVDISKSHGINIIQNDQSYNYFLKMMYLQSTKEIIPYENQDIIYN